MTLSRGEIIVLVSTFGAVALSAVVHIGIREWYQPDLRYETGGYYIFQDSAVTSLRITNHGHSDAETVVVVVNFGYPIRDASIDSRAVVFNIMSGKIGDKDMTVGIKRLVPEQSVSIFFAIDHKGTPSQSLPTDFLTTLTFKGGTGKTGLPIFNPATLILLAVMLTYTLLFAIYVAYIMGKRKKHHERISEMIELALEAHNSGLSREDMLSRAKAVTAKEFYRGDTLRETAVRVYDAIDKKDIPGGTG